MPKEKLPEIPEYLKADQITYDLNGTEIRLYNVKVYLKNPFEIAIEAERGDFGGIEFPDYKLPLKIATNEGWEVEIDNIFINKVSTHIEIKKPIEVRITGDTTKLRAVKGERGEDGEVEVYLPIGDFHWFSGRDPENPMFKLGYVQFEPEPLKDTKLYELKPLDIDGYSAVLIYKNSREKADGFIKTTWDDFYWLISLGLGRWANASHKFVRYKKGLEIEIIPASKQKAFYGPLNFYGYNKIESYINSCFDSYVKYKSDLGFQNLINWYILMNQTSSLHLQFLIGVVLLESLKYRFAKNIKRYPQKKNKNKWGPFLKSPKGVYGAKELLELLKEHFRSEDDRFIELFESFRNQIIHEGGFSEKNGFRFGDAFILQNSIAKLLFKILGYEGEIEEREFYEF